MNKVAVSARRKKIALALGVVADAAQGGLFASMPALAWIPSDGLDVVVAVALVALLGFRWRFMLALGLELVPAVQVFPSWTAFVLSLPTGEPEAPRLVTSSSRT